MIRFRRILIATDFSENAARAVERALLLPLVQGATLRLVHVLPRGLPAMLQARAEKRAVDAVEALAALVSRRARQARHDVRVVPAVASGPPFAEIIRDARRARSELVVLGRHGTGRRPSTGPGSTACRVIRHGDGPVLVVRKSPHRAYRRLLVAVDLDEAAVQVLRLAHRVVGASVESMPVLHCVHLPFAGFLRMGMTGQEMRTHRSEAALNARKRLEGLLRIGTGWRPAPKPAVRVGDPRFLILREASRRAADLVVVGTHGRTGIPHALLGSVAEAVIAGSSHDVLLARSPRLTVPARRPVDRGANAATRARSSRSRGS